MRIILRTFVTAAVVTATAALTAPAAYADHTFVDCRLFATATETVLSSGETRYSGYAAGYVVSLVQETVSIECFVSVDGVEVATTPRGVLFSPNGKTVSAGPVSFTATDEQTVEICARWTAGTETGTSCFPTRREVVPFATVLGQVNDLVAPILCTVTNFIDDNVLDVRGAIDIAPDGDVTVLGVRVLDCAPADPGGVLGGAVKVIVG